MYIVHKYIQASHRSDSRVVFKAQTQFDEFQNGVIEL